MLITPNCRGNHVTCYNVYGKKISEGQERRNFESVRALFVICIRATTLHPLYNFALVLHENALVFSQLEERNLQLFILPFTDLFGTNIMTKVLSTIIVNAIGTET